MDELLKSLAEQIPLVIVLLYWLRQEHTERMDERTYYRAKIEALIRFVLRKGQPGEDETP